MKIYDIISEVGIPGAGIVQRLATKLAPAAAKINAAKTAKATATANTAANAKIISTVLGSKADTILNWAYTVGISVPIATAAFEIHTLNVKLKAGKIDQETYDNDARFYLGKCVTQILAIGAFRTALKGGASIINSVPLPGTTMLSSLVSKLSPALAAGFGVWLATPGPAGGARPFTEWFVGESFSSGIARDWIGSWAKAGYDKVLGKASDADTNDVPTGDVLPLDKSAVPGSGVAAPAGVQRDMYTGARLN